MKKFLLYFMATTTLFAAPQAVVFDFGGVMTKEVNREAVVHFLCESLQLSKTAFEQANLEKRKAVKLGKTDEEFWIEFAKRHQVHLSNDWSQKFKAVLKEAIGVNPEMYALVDTLKEKQIQVALLSNIDKRLSKLIREFGLYQSFDPCLLSCDIGVEKPDPKAYQILLQTLHLSPADIVFIDDLPENITAATQAGIDAILFESAEQTREELKKRGLLEETQQHTIVRRAAFDIGSGQIKMQVSDVDLTANKLVNILLTDTAYVGLREDLVNSLDGRLSAEIQNKTVAAISELMKKAALFHPEAYHAIATEPLRLASNANILVERIKNETGVPVTIVSQEEEGILGFISAVSETDVDLSQVVSWDLGGGSFQITTKHGDRYFVYQKKLGKTPMKNALLTIQGKDITQTLSPNPISQIQATQAIQYVKETMKDVPAELRQKLNDPHVIVLGIGINPLWGMPQSTHFDKTRVLKEIHCRLNLDDLAIRTLDAIPADRKEAFPHIVSNLILAYGVMEALNISQVHYVGTLGANAIGALLSPNYWKKNTQTLSQSTLPITQDGTNHS
ncbi:MAG: HAD-IA family hydrolase [Simkania sp.]|nr:HAD-IA family hydrolase [Simkania sp.]